MSAGLAFTMMRPCATWRASWPAQLISCLYVQGTCASGECKGPGQCKGQCQGRCQGQGQGQGQGHCNQMTQAMREAMENMDVNLSLDPTAAESRTHCKRCGPVSMLLS